MTIRLADLIVHSESPLNAETSPRVLRQAFLTPQAALYIRTHGSIPDVKLDDYRVRVAGLVTKQTEFSIDELQARFPSATVTATLQCAGNRRADLRAVRPVSGDPWSVGAIGNAAWTGVRLVDVLHATGMAAAATDVEFVGCDAVEVKGERFNYAVSIPMAKAMSADVTLAWSVNGEPLAPEHGFPLRVIVPGFAGVRCVKWLTGINLLDRPSTGYMQRNEYMFFSSESTEDNADHKHAFTINAMPLNSAICEPQSRAQLTAGPCAIRGYAIATGSSIVSRVDVSADGGRTWHQADIAVRAERWSWTFWEITLELPSGEHELAVRAWDEAGQTQPSLPDDMWNYKGYLSASWHRISVNVEK